MTGTSTRPAFAAARQRRSPATSSNVPVFLPGRTTSGSMMPTPLAIVAASSSSVAGSKCFRGFSADATIAARGSIWNCNSPSSLHLHGEIGKPGLLAQERQLHHASRAVPLLGDDQLRDAGVGTVRVAAIDLVPVDQQDDVAILFQRAGLAQVRELRPMVTPELGRPGQLRQHEDRDVELLRPALQRARE